MKITFNHVDDDYYGIEEHVKPVANIAVKYDIFIGILCEILNTYDTYNEHVANDVKETLMYEEYKIRDKSESVKNDYTIFADKVYNFYWTVVDDEFGKQIKKYDEDLYYKKGLRYADNRLQRYRGILFEEIVIATVEDRFKDSTFCTGCRISINGVRILARYGEGNSSHKETIDVAGWNHDVNYGEFYECKINPKRFEIENYKFFVEIKKELDKNGITRYVLALVSAEAKEHLRAQKEYIEKMDSECAIMFDLIGREEIFNILNYSIPEIA